MRHAFSSGLLALAVMVASGSAGAHHSFSMFEMSSEKTVAGTVKKVQWTNPHIWIWIEVANGKGGADVYGFEGMSPNFLERRGWKRTTLKVGDAITVVYRPLRDGTNGGMFLSTKLADGTALSMGGGKPAN